jgi:hypothetical protein
MSIIKISPIVTGVVVLSQDAPETTVISINQGQQGPAGVSLKIENYGDNRLTTSDGTPNGLYAESDLTFDGALKVSGINVSLSGHTHLFSEISGISGSISSGINSYLNNLSSISDACDIRYVIIQDSDNNTQLVDIFNLPKALSVIDGGGVLYSGC